MRSSSTISTRAHSVADRMPGWQCKRYDLRGTPAWRSCACRGWPGTYMWAPAPRSRAWATARVGGAAPRAGLARCPADQVARAVGRRTTWGFPDATVLRDRCGGRRGQAPASCAGGCGLTGRLCCRRAHALVQADGQARGAVVFPSATPQPAPPGTARWDILEQPRSRPEVGLPPVVTTTASPARRLTSSGWNSCWRKKRQRTCAQGIGVVQPGWTGRELARGLVPLALRSLVTRPVR